MNGITLLWLYILIFLHQTATICCKGTQYLGCISLYSYIKPQLSHPRLLLLTVVYPYIPTSNRNSATNLNKSALVVYPYIPTSNRNDIPVDNHKERVVYPYIPTSNRNRRRNMEKDANVVVNVQLLLIGFKQSTFEYPVLC